MRQGIKCALISNTRRYSGGTRLKIMPGESLYEKKTFNKAKIIRVSLFFIDCNNLKHFVVQILLFFRFVNTAF